MKIHELAAKAERDFHTVLTMESSMLFVATAKSQQYLLDFVRYCKGGRGFGPKPPFNIKFVDQIAYSAVKELYSIKLSIH